METLAEAIWDGVTAWIDDSWPRFFIVAGAATALIGAAVLALCWG